ncbi:MAG: glutathione S-transferase N-terminal domain-containing protein [Candidatus Pacearchaeota archaeon]|nr:glutathione S-transferase N-terminal domain-containing protein [Candidatus Pacearchaeota archaeon]
MTIKVYSTPTCPWCTRTKEFLKKNHVQFEDIDVSRDVNAAREMVAKSGQMGVPVIDANGKIIIGFNEAELKEAINSRKK